MAIFDAMAGQFDQHRALPDFIMEEIRSALWKTGSLSQGGRLLEVGAGTGRIGKIFVAAGDRF